MTYNVFSGTLNPTHSLTYYNLEDTIIHMLVLLLSRIMIFCLLPLKCLTTVVLMHAYCSLDD